MKLRIGWLRFEFSFDTFFWYPYLMWGKYESLEEARYYGHRWFFIIHLWVLEIIITADVQEDAPTHP